MSDYLYCPYCAKPLVERTDLPGDDARSRRACADDQCGFVHWNNPVPVVAAIVEYERKILLARNAAWGEGVFALITGFLEAGETPQAGVAREVLEETALQVDSTELVGVYEFVCKNELIIVYHVRAHGAISLSPELIEYRLVEPEQLRSWRVGTSLWLDEWMRGRGLPFELVDKPGQ